MERIKRNDLKNHAESILKNYIDESLCFLGPSEHDSEMIEILYQQYINSGFLSITAPEEDPPTISFLTMDSLKNYGRGRSIKQGNIRLNFKKLMETIPNMVGMAANIAVDNPVSKVCAALNLCKALRDVFTVEISKEQAFLIVSLWKKCDSRHRITIEEGFNAVNVLLKEYGEEALNNTKYNYLLDCLENIGCIELEDGVIWLREWISRNYIDSI